MLNRPLNVAVKLSLARQTTYQDIDDSLKEFQIVQMDDVFVDSIREEVISDSW